MQHYLTNLRSDLSFQGVPTETLDAFISFWFLFELSIALVLI